MCYSHIKLFFLDYSLVAVAVVMSVFVVEEEEVVVMMFVVSVFVVEEEEVVVMMVMSTVTVAAAPCKC